MNSRGPQRGSYDSKLSLRRFERSCQRSELRVCCGMGGPELCNPCQKRVDVILVLLLSLEQSIRVVSYLLAFLGYMLWRSEAQLI